MWLGGPGAALEQGRALFHPELVLLVDDDQPEVGELTASLSRAWVPTTIPARPVAICCRTSRRDAVDADPVSSTTWVPEVSPVSVPAAPSPRGWR